MRYRPRDRSASPSRRQRLIAAFAACLHLVGAAPASANIIGPEDGRGPITALGPKLGLSAAEIEQIRNSTGYVICPGLLPNGRPKVGSGALLISSTIVIMAAHIVVGYEDGLPGKKCFFQNQPGAGKYERVPVSPADDSLFVGMLDVAKLLATDRLVDRRNDFAVLRLARAPAGAKAFEPYAGTRDAVIDRRVVPIFAGQADMRSADRSIPIVQDCTIRRSETLLISDCDMGAVGSGGPMLVREEGELRIAGIHVSSGSEELNGRPFDFFANSYSAHVPIAGWVLAVARAMAEERPLP